MSAQPLLHNGWTLYAHPVFLDQLATLTAQVNTLRQKNPLGYTQKNASKRLFPSTAKNACGGWLIIVLRLFLNLQD